MTGFADRRVPWEFDDSVDLGLFAMLVAGGVKGGGTGLGCDWGRDANVVGKEGQ